MKCCRGVTFLELLITLAIIFILASVALPIAKVSSKRSQELELRQTLRTVRSAIDQFHLDWDRNGDTPVGQLCLKNKLSCLEEVAQSGYPKSLEQLLKMDLSGEEAQLGEKPKIVRYLRQIPIDPLTGENEWLLRCYQDEADTDRWCGEDVFDLHTTSPKSALDKTKYRDW